MSQGEESAFFVSDQSSTCVGGRSMKRVLWVWCSVLGFYLPLFWFIRVFAISPPLVTHSFLFKALRDRWTGASSLVPRQQRSGGRGWSGDIESLEERPGGAWVISPGRPAASPCPVMNHWLIVGSQEGNRRATFMKNSPFLENRVLSHHNKVTLLIQSCHQRQIHWRDHWS